jgi:adenylate cyclase
MGENSIPSIKIDLNEFKLHIYFKNKTPLTLHFNSPSRRFYLSLITLVVYEMKKLGKIKTIPLQEHFDLLVLLNESIGGAAGSSDKVNLMHRIYTKWKDALPNLEEAPLFKILGRHKEESEGVIGKIYSFTDLEKDGWANLFGYLGSEENVRLKFALDKIGVGLDEAEIIFGDFRNAEAWEKFLADLKYDRSEKCEPMEKTAVPETPAGPPSPSQERKVAWVFRYRWAMLVLVIGIGAAVIWKHYSSPVLIPIASVNQMKLPLPDEPSIAVMPFVNMSGDPKQEFLCDGITEEIITHLSKVPGLFVIARNSTFIYKGKPVKVKQVSEELGVRYVLEGSLQRTGDRLRINVQLIDALTGKHFWAERYDRDLKDLFALQDEITLKILTGVQVKLAMGGEPFRVEKYAEKYYRGKQGFDCYLKLMQAWGYYTRFTIEDNNLARQLVEKAIATCPENPMGYLWLGWVCWSDSWMGGLKSPRECIEKGIELAQKVLTIDDSIATAHALLSRLYLSNREYGKAIAEGERAVALNPGGYAANFHYAYSLTFAGRPEEAIPLFEKTIRLSPFGPFYLYNDFAIALGITGRFEEAVSATKKAIQLAPERTDLHLSLVAPYIRMGREKEARAEAALFIRSYPNFSVDSWAKSSLFKDQLVTDRISKAWRQAGLK